LQYLSKDGNEAILRKKKNVAGDVFYNGESPIFEAASICQCSVLEDSNFKDCRYLKPLYVGWQKMKEVKQWWMTNTGGCLP
jgi:hypothetical protein